jgi:hypothetical protein
LIRAPSVFDELGDHGVVDWLGDANADHVPSASGHDVSRQQNAWLDALCGLSRLARGSSQGRLKQVEPAVSQRNQVQHRGDCKLAFERHPERAVKYRLACSVLDIPDHRPVPLLKRDVGSGAKHQRADADRRGEQHRKCGKRDAARRAPGWPRLAGGPLQRSLELGGSAEPMAEV